MNILGINYFFHDSTACILVDGVVRVAIEEERLTRHKHTGKFPRRAVDKCLEASGLSACDVDAIAVSIKPGKDWGKKVAYGFAHVFNAKPFAKHELLHTYYKQQSLGEWHRSLWPDRASAPKIHFIAHHLAHAGGSFLVSPYDSAAILSLDGSGEWSTSLLGKGEGTRITPIGESFFPMSVGAFYEAATQFCGFRPNYDEGKTMGLAPMGDSERFHKQVSELLWVDGNGGIGIDLTYFGYQHWGHNRCNEKFYQVFGQPRMADEDFQQNHLDVAAAFQRVLEDRALELCKILKQKTGEQYLVMAGGVSLNSVMNGRIVRESDFDDIYVMPAAGDNGTAIGAASYLYHSILGNPRCAVHDNPYIGNEYSNQEIEAVLKECKLSHEYHDDIETVAANYLNQGMILGWHQGKMEIGPRALGNRSILANPTLSAMKDKINEEVKHREAYRPFAPSATVENKNRYFENLGDSPFMLKVCDVLPSARDKLPAITHVDGSGRLQTVDKRTNPRYHKLISEFGRLSGVPVLLNTSFNIMGEPIVESPIDAIRCFVSTGLDKLAIGNYLISK